MRCLLLKQRLRNELTNRIGCPSVCSSHVGHNARSPFITKMNAKRKRTDLSLSQNIGVIDVLDKNISQSDSARHLGISVPGFTHGRQKNKKICLQWEWNQNTDRKRRRTGNVADVETALKTWFTEADVETALKTWFTEARFHDRFWKKWQKKLAETLNKPDLCMHMCLQLRDNIIFLTIVTSLEFLTTLTFSLARILTYFYWAIRACS